ncbi:hypothetical protein [Streptomyces sp. NBC_01233]|uniref:hypothetical protein n=1 Tax=Streptomyces sp. NBC_01233 TaxID=2903787 RepID=UPI002E11F706|nr:hypothetical protein OG332_20345 [Streptomyces sp. NBC_01233]
MLTGLLASLAVFLLQLSNGTGRKVGALTEPATVVTVSGLALLVNRVVRRSGEQLASARGIAEAAQRAVPPKPAERIGGLHVSAWYEAAQADAFVGGDLYAVQDTPYGVRLAVGDVRGKGLGAAADRAGGTPGRRRVTQRVRSGALRKFIDKASRSWRGRRGEVVT